MCEILVVKKNEQDLRFSKTAIEDAIDCNNDGCGYAIFEKNNKGYTIKEINHINYEQETQSYTKTKTSNQYANDWSKWDDRDYVAATAMEEDYETARDAFTKFEFVDGDCVKLTSVKGTVMTLTMPKEIRSVKLKPLDDQKLALFDWLSSKNIECNPWYDDDKLNIKKIEKEITPKPAVPQPIKTTYKYKVPSADSVDHAIEKLYNKQLQLQQNQLLIMHFRNATSGMTSENTQPIISGNFMTIHNGIFTAKGNQNQSDTRIFTEELDTEYKKRKVTPKKEQEFLDTYLAKVDGWYSIFIYSWKTEQLYYFRKGASFYSSYNSLLLSTKPARFPTVQEEVQSFVC